MTGRERHLNVAITPYMPSVACQNTRQLEPPLGSCTLVLDAFPVSKIVQYFGPAGDIGVAVSLPRTVGSRKFTFLRLMSFWELLAWRCIFTC